MGHVTASFTQRGQRAYLDSAVAADSLVAAAAENAGYTLDVSAGNVYLILRTELEETAGGAASQSGDSEYQVNGGGYAALTAATTDVRINTGHACTTTDGATIGNVLTTSTATFNTGLFDNNAATGNIAFAGNDHGEFGLAVEFVAANLNNNDTVNIRIAGVAGWTNVITITISKSVDVNVNTNVDALTLATFPASIVALRTGVDFDETNDYLSGVNTSSAGDTKNLLISFWVKLGTSRTLWDNVFQINGNRILVRFDNASPAFVEVTASDTIGAETLKIRSDAVFTESEWHHCLIAADLANTTAQIYVDDAEAEDAGYGSRNITNPSVGIDWSDVTGAAVGADTGGGNKILGALQVAYVTNEYFDISNVTNRRKFITADGRPDIAALGSDGSGATGTQPLIYQRDPYDSFETNYGSLGDFTVNGALTDEGTYPQVSVGTNVLANVDALTLAEQAATVNAETNVQANADSLTLTEFAATVALAINIAANVAALTLTSFAASVNAETNVNAAVDALTLTEQQATVNAETNILASADGLTLTELQAGVSLGVVIQASTDALTLAEFTATVNAETNILAAADSLALTEFAATISIGADTVVNANVHALTLAEFAAAVNAETSIAATVDALALTELPATINAETNVAASVDALALSELPAGINAETNVLANVGALTLTELAASVAFGADTNIAANVDNLTLATLPTTVNAATNIQAATDALTLVGYPAAVNAAINLAASTDSLVLTEYQAVVNAAGVHRAENIMDAVIAAVTGLTTTGVNVYRARAYPLEVSDVPALLVWQGADSSQTELLGDGVISLLEVHIDAIVREPTAQIDTTLNLIREEVTVALMADYKLGLNYVAGIMERSADEPELSDEGDAPIAQMRTNWDVQYKHSRTDPSI